jgi:lipopolysaccharide transport system ATP-binding protein
MMPKDAIVIQNVSKTFRIPHERKTTLFEHLSGIFDGKKGYEEFEALKNVKFTVKKGEAIGIIGENGSGKSTLLKIIANILRPSRGTVKINGKITSFLELGVGFEPNLTAKENIFLYGTVMGLSDHEIEEKLEEILEFSGLKRFEDSKLKNLSSGMQVRLAFATAIQTKPEILLMDEVLAVGDMEFQQKCLDVFQRYITERKTILFVSHDMNSVRRFCKKSVLLRRGEQVAFGNSNEIIDRYVYGSAEKVTEVPTQPAEKDKQQEKKTRWGDKKVEITGVTFFNKFAKESETFISGDPMKIRMFYFAPEKVMDPVFGMALYSEKDVHCFGTNTMIKGLDSGVIQGEGYIDIEIEKITILNGRYFLTACVHAKDHTPYDWRDKEYTFNVLNTGEDAGLFDLPCKWKLCKQRQLQ